MFSKLLTLVLLSLCSTEDRTEWAVRIVSPFLLEPLGAEEMHVSIDVSALPTPTAHILTINGREVTRHMLQDRPSSRNLDLESDRRYVPGLTWF